MLPNNENDAVQLKHWLEQEALKGLRSGESVPMTKEEWQAIRDAVARNRNEKPR